VANRPKNQKTKKPDEAKSGTVCSKTIDGIFTILDRRLFQEKRRMFGGYLPKRELTEENLALQSERALF